MNEKKNKEKRIILTTKMSELLLQRRKKLKFSAKEISEILEIPQSTLKKYESSRAKSIDSERYEKILNCYNKLKKEKTRPNRIQVEIEMIPFTKSMSKEIRRKRKKFNFSAQELAKEIGIKAGTYKNYERGAQKTIPNWIYQKILYIFDDLKNNNKERISQIKDRTNLTKTLSQNLYKKRKNLNLSYKTVGKALKISSSSLNSYEKMGLRTISRELLEKLLDFYDEYEKNNFMDKGEELIPITPEMINYIKTERQKINVSTRKLSVEVGLSANVIYGYEILKRKSMTKNTFEKIKKFFEKFNEKTAKDSILVTKEIRKRVAFIRINLNISRKRLAKLLHTTLSNVKKIETKSMTFIDISLYNRIDELLEDIEPLKEIIKKEKKVAYQHRLDKSTDKRIPLTKEMSLLLREKRLATNFSYNEIGEKLGESGAKIRSYEVSDTKTIPKNLYDDLLYLYNDIDKGMMKSKYREKRILLPKETSIFLKNERIKSKLSGEDLRKMTGISGSRVYNYESRRVKTISERDYDVLVAFYKKFNK